MAFEFNPRQHTLTKPLDLVGQGLHSGRPAAVRILPAPAGHGLRFAHRTETTAAPLLASWRNVTDTTLSTTLGDAVGRRFATVEHLLSALHGSGIDNALVELIGGELPILDGSAQPYLDFLQSAPLRIQSSLRPVLRVERPIGVRDGERFVIAAPCPYRRFTAEIDFESPAIGHQRRSLCLDDGSFATEIAPARTFGFAEELDRLHREGLARGGSRKNAIVVHGGEVINPEGLRFDDEFVRHKLLDMVGDMALAGMPIIGHIFGYRPGHAMNTALVKALLTEPGAVSVHPARPAVQEDGVDDPIACILAQPERSAWTVWSALVDGSHGTARRAMAASSETR